MSLHSHGNGLNVLPMVVIKVSGSIDKCPLRISTLSTGQAVASANSNSALCKWSVADLEKVAVLLLRPVAFPKGLHWQTGL